MARPIPIGVRGEASEAVEMRHTLSAHHRELPSVYSTPDMGRLMETACFRALQPFCDDGEITVGTAIQVEHRAASGIGMQIHAEAEVESFDGRFYTMRVRAHDGTQQIGSRTVGRAVVHVPSFVKRMREKASGSRRGRNRPNRQNRRDKLWSPRPTKRYSSGSSIADPVYSSCRTRGM